MLTPGTKEWVLPVKVGPLQDNDFLNHPTPTCPQHA